MSKEFGDTPIYMNLQRVNPGAISCNTLRGQRGANYPHFLACLLPNWSFQATAYGRA